MLRLAWPDVTPSRTCASWICGTLTMWPHRTPWSSWCFIWPEAACPASARGITFRLVQRQRVPSIFCRYVLSLSCRSAVLPSLLAFMTAQTRDLITAHSDLSPLHVNARDLVEQRRWRYYWCSWKVGSRSDGLFTEGPG